MNAKNERTGGKTMKRWMAALCALMLIPTMAGAELISITELAKKVPKTWTEEIDVNGKIISIDAPIYVPEVEHVEVKRVSRIQANETKLKEMLAHDEDLLESSIKSTRISRKDGEKQFGDDGFYNTTEICLNNGWKLNETELAQIYAKNQEYSVLELKDQLEGAIRSLYDDRISMRISKIEVRSPFQKKEKGGLFEYGKLTGVGGYKLYIHEIVDGIPLISNSYIGHFTSNCETKTGEAMAFANPSISLLYFDETYNMFIANNVVVEVETVGEYSNFCTFADVQNSLKKEIQQGNVIRVYNVQFGYVICADSKEKYTKKRGEERYILAPAWVVQCSYTGGKAPTTPYPELEETSDEAYDYETKDLDLKTLLINARTGKICDPYAKGDSKYYADQLM